MALCASSPHPPRRSSARFYTASTHLGQSESPLPARMVATRECPLTGWEPSSQTDPLRTFEISGCRVGAAPARQTNLMRQPVVTPD